MEFVNSVIGWFQATLLSFLISVPVIIAVTIFLDKLRVKHLDVASLFLSIFVYAMVFDYFYFR